MTPGDVWWALPLGGVLALTMVETFRAFIRRRGDDDNRNADLAQARCALQAIEGQLHDLNRSISTLVKLAEPPKPTPDLVHVAGNISSALCSLHLKLDKLTAALERRG